MITTRGRQLIIDGEPRVIFAGEVHYFRLARDEWRDRLVALRDTGAQAVATYIPWVVHELPDGRIDVTGETADWRDLGAFCDLAAELGLLVIARPGPFCMAELKNEGIPHRVYGLPGVVAPGWRGAPPPTRDLDYLAPAFLAEARRWYDAVLPVLAERHHDQGGPVIAIQLDNEIGMLAWVSNSPALTEAVAADWRAWLAVQDRLGRHPGLTGSEPAAVLRYLADPPADAALAVADDLMRFCRDRFRRYTDTLAGWVAGHGLATLPLLINIHGTGGGRGLTYPIGISQLLGTWRNRPGTVAGSDMYLGDLTVGNVADFVLGNVFAAATAGPNQPLTALEFEAGDGDYGQDLGALVPPEATALKTRLAHALGNRLINFYLFAGGTNPPLDTDPDLPGGDGIDRIAFTGEEHGFAAPLGPTGRPSRTLPALTEVITDLNRIEQRAAGMVPHADLAYGFVADHYLTEYRVPDDPATRDLQDELARFRGFGPRQILARALVLGGYGLAGVDLSPHDDLDRTDPRPIDQAELPERLTPAGHPVLALVSGRSLAAVTQRLLADYVAAGGRLLLAGALPVLDELGRDCRLLADALTITVGEPLPDQVVDRRGRTRSNHPTVRLDPATTGLTRPEVAVGFAQPLRHSEATVLVRTTGGDAVGLEVRHGAGTAILLTTDYPCDLAVYAALLDRLGVRPRYRTDASDPGLVVAAMISPDGGDELVQLINVAPYPIETSVWRAAELMTPRPITVGARSAVLLQ
ncbi:beta-galactosidase [Microlunatus parietis]|uniref:Beta-galactosidase n=1 Tax=Microlunatus parietis TaxID=682979 RepID=A0A7Y9IB64_9ACTN|nr:beta-galactosidase [Microlunatus parietis]NYE73698.1 beta-galactosidase [Microlunatus parietis]